MLTCVRLFVTLWTQRSPLSMEFSRQEYSIPFSRRSSRPRDWSRVSCIAGRFFTIWANREQKRAWKGEGNFEAIWGLGKMVLVGFKCWNLPWEAHGWSLQSPKSQWKCKTPFFLMLIQSWVDFYLYHWNHLRSSSQVWNNSFSLWCIRRTFKKIWQVVTK